MEHIHEASMGAREVSAPIAPVGLTDQPEHGDLDAIGAPAIP